MNNVDMLRAAAAERGEGLKEIDKLASMLTVRGISFIKRRLFDGGQILVPGEWDAVCHFGSYGGPQGLLEVTGDPVTLPGEGAVAGWLTAEDVIRRLEANAGGASPSPTGEQIGVPGEQIGVPGEQIGVPGEQIGVPGDIVPQAEV